MAILLKKHIVATPGVLGGKPRIDRTRISVEHIAIAYNSGLSIENIVESYQGITHSDVFAALAYYYDNKEEIDAKIKQDAEEYKKMHSQNLQETSRLREKIKKRKVKKGTISAD